MKKTLILSCLALALAIGLPWLQWRSLSQRESMETGAAETTHATQDEPAAAVPEPAAPSPAVDLAAPQTIVVLTADGEREMDMQAYLTGVLAAEMPASFAPEALKAQAVAARSYALCQALSGKHGTAQVCTDPGCCQAWLSDEKMQENWGERYAENLARIRAAVEETQGEILAYEGKPALALFHSSSAGATEDSGQVWNARPYLVSVASPETAADVPDYVSFVQCTALDFRDTILSFHPEADLTGEAADWLGPIRRDASGRVSEAEIGGVVLSGTELRSLFALRSTAFSLEQLDGAFRFTVTGHGHGVGMSQYGAQVLAESGADYREILAHYYPGTVLVEGRR